MGFDPNKPYSVVKKEEPTTNDQKSPPSGFDPNKPYKVKKKDVAGTSQTSPSTPSPSGQMPGFVQSQKLDVNAAPSISPSTPQPVSTKPAQLPQFIYNNNLNTGAKVTGRGGYNPSAGEIMDANLMSPAKITDSVSGSGPANYSWAPSGPTSAPTPTAATNTVAGVVQTQLIPKEYQEYTYKKEFDKIQLENASVRANTPGTPEYQTKVAAQYPGVAIAPVTQEQNTLDKAREFSDWYLLNTNPSLYNDLKNPVKYYSQEQEPSLIQSIITPGSAAVDDYTRPFALQTARATYDTHSLNNYTKAINRSLEINKSFLDSTYGPQKLAYNSAYDTLMAWPKDPNGIYIANTPEEQTKLSETMNTYNLLISDEGFVSAMQAVYKDHQDLVAADSAHKQVIRENPLFFIAQDQAKQRSAEEQARLSQLGPVFEWKAKNIDNPAAMAIVDAAIGLTYLPKAFGDGDEFGWTDDLYNKASIGRELMVVPSLPVEDSTVSKFVSSAVTMGIMIGTGYAAGAALGGSELALMAGQAAAGTVTTMEGYYRAGKEAGMSDSDAESYSIVSGLVQGMLEMVNPEAAFGASVTKKSASEYMRILAEGGTKSFARKEATKEIFRNIAAENVQELMQQMAEWGVNMKANQITGANLDVGEKWGKTVAETALITTLISGIVGGVNASSIPNRLGAEATYAAGLDPETYRLRTASMVVDGQISAEKASEINDKINTAERIVSKIPSNISPEKAVQLIPKIQEKIRLEDELNKADDSLKPAVEEKISAVSEEIRQTAGIKTEEEKVIESNQKMADEKEAADLQMLSTMGVIAPEQQTRLDELNSKAAMAPAETTGAETKTTADATQERIVPENRQQQYQDAQEGGVPTETGGSNITEQVGQVQQEKVSSETTPVEEAAAAVQRALQSTGITVRTLTEEEAVAEGYSDKTQGMFEDKKGQIVVVPSRIQEGWGTTVVWHEGAHPVANIIRNTDKPTYDAMVRGIKNLAQNATGKNKAQLDDVIKFAEEYRADRGQEGVDDESVVEFIGRVGSGMIDIDALPKSFKQRFVDLINSMATKLGLGTVMKDTDAQTLINKAKEVSDVLKSGRDIAEVVGAENVKKFENAVPGSEIISGEINRDRIGQARIITSPIESVYEEKETVKLPTRSLEDVLDQFNDKISVINSDATKVGWVTLTSGKEIFLYGGPGFLSIKDNVDNGIGFASTEISKVKMAMNLVKEVNDGGTGVIMIGVQNPKSTFGNSYSVEYVFDAIGQLPKSVLSSSEFRSEFFGEDIVAIKQAIGEDRYKKFVDKYKKADFSSPEVFSSVSSELINNLSGISPDTFKARRAIVEQLIAGIGVNNPKKLISKSLYSNFGINAEKVLYELGVKEIVDLYLETGQWGLITSGFEVNPNEDVLSFQDKGIKHPLFNAKFPGSNPFKLDGGYLLNELFERKYLGTNVKGKPFYLESAQVTSQSMYHGGKLSEGMTGVTFAKLPKKGQESRGKRMDVVADTYVQSGLTEDGNDYVFFHVSSADEKSIRKGIDSRKFYSTRTSKSEKGTQYGVASFYTKPTDGERMVGGDKYVVRVSKDKVYPMDTDPKGYKDQVEKTVPENTPFRAEVIKKKMADLAAKDGYQMAVGEWYYSRTGEKTDMPEFRADALVALKPTNESASDFVSNEESGMERIAHPEETKYKDAAQYEALGEAAYDYLSEKGRYDDAYDIARDMYMYNKVPTEQEMKTLMKGMPKKISNMAPKTGQQSMGQRMNNLAPKAGSIGGDVEATAKALEGKNLEEIEKEYAFIVADELREEQFSSYEDYLSAWDALNSERGFDLKNIAEAYHKAKADRTNPELVKAVEQSLKETPKFDSNMVPKTGQQSKGQRMNVAGVEYTELSIAAQETLRARRSKKSYFDDAVSKMPKSDFDKDEVERIIKEENFGIITGENPMGTPTVSSANSKLNDKAVKWLESRGYEVAPVTGKYGQTENSFFVPGLTVADAVEFAKAFNQDSVVTNEGIVYQDGRMNPRTMDDSFNVDSSSPTEDFVSAIRTEDGNVMGFKVGIDLETKVDSSYVAQSAVDTKSTEYAKSSVDKAISERSDAKVQDDADTLSAINTTAEEAKSSSIINGSTKISQLKDQVVKAVEDGLISDATAKKVVDDAIKSYDEKVAASKSSIKESIDKIKDVISKFLFNPEGQYVTNPETGEKTKISKSSIFDVEATVNFATDAIKKAVDKGVDLAVALGNFKSALVNHPTIKNNIANNVITEGEFEAMLDAEIAKLIQANNLKNKTQNAKASKSLERAMASQHVSQEVKDSLQAQGLTYSPDTIAASVSDAQAIVEYFDAEGALDVLEENMANVAKSPDVVPHTRTLILAEIFDKRLKYSDSISNDPAVSDQAKKAASDKAANTAIAFSVINGQYAKSVSMASKRMKQIIGMSPKGLELFVDAQVKMKSEKFVKSNKMQRKIKKAIIKASQTGNAADAKKAIMDSMMPDYAKLDDKFKTSIDGYISTAINSNGQIDKKALDKALASYYSGLQMNDKLKQAILDHTAAIKDMNEKEKNFSKIIEEYKNALSGLDPGTPAYKAVVAKYEKATIEAANATREADFKARLEGERLGRQIREGRDIWQSLASIMKLNMLTPQTIVVNVFGYLPAIMLRGAAVTIATPIDWAITSAMKAFRPNVSRTTNLLDIYGGIKYGAAYGVKEGFRKIKYGSTSEDVEKYNMKHSMNAFQAWRDLFAKKSPVELNNIENRVSAFIEGTFGMPADGMSRLLSIGDKIPFEIAKANKLTTLANETYVKNKDGTQRKMNNAEKLEFIFNPPAEAADIAEEFAQKMTYQQKNVMSDMVNRSQKDIASKISEGVSGAMGRHLSGFANLLVGTVVPFTKTPINLLTETFHFTNPAFGLAYSVGYAAKSVKAEKAGDSFKASYFRGESIRNFSRASVAMGVAMVAANMIKNGLMTGDEDEMKFDAKSMQYENVRARSLNISALMRMFSGQDDWSDFRQGDLTVNYSKMGTLGLGLSSWADFYRDKDDNQINSGIDELMSLSGLGGISLANVKSMIDQSFMTGIAGVIDAMRDDQGNKVKKFETNTAVALSRIFIPNTLSATSKASMDFTKETRTEGKDTEVGDMIMNRLRVDLGIMGTADELPSKITLWGEPVTSTPHGTNPWVYYMFDPVQSYSPDTETVGFKIQQMYFNTPKSMSNVRNKMIPSKPDQTITIGKQDVMLTGAEYEDYQIAVGQKRKTLVSNYVGSDVWNASSVEVRAERLDYLYSYAAKIAKGEFIMNTPRLLKISSGTSYIPF